METDQINEFLEYFEMVEPPFTITEEAIHLIDHQEPIPGKLISEFIELWEGQCDDYTEYLPLLRMPPQKEYQAVIYWKASLLKYEYILVTFNQYGLISRKVISTKIIEGSIIKSSAARIESDLIIYIMAGGSFDADNYDPQNSQSFSMEIMENGEIIFSVD